MASQNLISVSAGPSYDLARHTQVLVNNPEPTIVSGEDADIELNVRIQSYHGHPTDSPSSSPYFSQEPHVTNDDQYGISIKFTPKTPKSAEESAGRTGISGDSLQFGNDFDEPIRDKLPPGFSTAMNIVKWWIDPGLDGDVYADSPHLYGPALSSFNVLHVGHGVKEDDKGGLWFVEGGDKEGKKRRDEAGMPATSKERMKWALNEDARKGWEFEYGRTYGFDFFNPYLDFQNFAIKLPGFHLSILKYWDGQPLR